MIKIWCEECKGKGTWVYDNKFPKDLISCKVCNGKGFVETELTELERLAQIGRYTEMAFEEIMSDFTIGLDTESRNFTTVDELIEWGEANENMV